MTVTSAARSALLARARAERPQAWLDDETFLDHACGFAANDEELAALNAGDLYLACACARGEPSASTSRGSASSRRP